MYSNTLKNEAMNNASPYVVQGLFLKKDSVMILLPFQNILFLKADSNYTHIIVHGSKELYTSSSTLGKIGERITCPYLCRVHRSYIVNLNHVSEIVANTLRIDQYYIPVGRTYHHVLQSFILV